MVAKELRWLTYLLTDLGEQPRLPPVLYVDSKAMIALCQEHRLEHRTKHIALRFFLARDLQQRGQLRLAYMATRANTADVFTKAPPPACFAFLNWSCDHLFSPSLPMEAVGGQEKVEHVSGEQGRAGAVAAAPPPLASAATVSAPAAAHVAPPLHSPAAAAAAPTAATGTPALPSPAASMTPLLSPAVSVTAPAATGGTPALPSPGAAMTPPLLSPVATATAPATAFMTPPLLSPAAATATETAAATAVTPPLLSPDAPTVTGAAAAAAAAAVNPSLLSPGAPTETAAAVPSQTAPAPPSPTSLNAAPRSGNRLQCPLQEHPQAPQRPAAEANEEGTAEQTGSQWVRRGNANDSRQPCPPQERSPLSHPLHPQSWHHGLQQPQYPHPPQLHLMHPQTRQVLDTPGGKEGWGGGGGATGANGGAQG
ncbi:unnamed protein product [Closterium sp. NIES-53]